ncbi:MAG: site-specific DNA-methyltransferase [Alphaproteobacteria bacterium]|nr:site-specific DNA-methyltransferase [Alphaproteobacteria bacterium]
MTLAWARVDRARRGAAMAQEIGAEKIERRAVADLVPYARNARAHSDEQISVLAASIGRYGFNNPVLVDEAGGIIAGHGRVLAAKRLGMETVPVVPLAHLTEDEKRAYILADNKTAELAGWDEDLLRIEVADLAEKDFDLSGIGFNEKEITKLLVEPDPTDDNGDEGSDPDSAPEAKSDPVSMLGDVWRLGAHRLVCGDSTDPETVEVLMVGQLADLVFTDPPYGVGYTGGKKKWVGIKNDDVVSGDLVAFLVAVFANLDAFSEKDAAWYIWHAANTSAEFYSALAETGRKASAQIVWVKNVMAGGFGHYRSRHEPCIYVSGKNYAGRDQDTVWNVKKEHGYLHPTQKPVRLVERALRNSSRRGDVVLDVFGGSGSTLIACERTGRAARLVELDPRYVDVIVRRWQEFTGEIATLEGSGKAFEEVAQERFAAAA